jgi:MraZ protein
VEVVLDKQGRILVPPYLRGYAKLDKDCVLAGVGTKFELWNKDIFESRRKVTEENFDTDMAALSEAGFELRL